VRSHGKKALFEAWERQIAEMADLGTAFPCVSTHFNPWTSPPPRTARCARNLLNSFLYIPLCFMLIYNDIPVSLRE